MQNKIELKNNRYRLGYHVSTPSGWMNDPNGFCYYKGYYHIFYQHYPYSADWGPMHWGHARSKDLVHWETLPIALAPDAPEDKNGCFSGSAIVKDDMLYLIYTGHHIYEENGDFWQDQNLAYSTDGIHFTKYENNPIIAKLPKDNTADFRDPKVWQQDGHFYMVLGSKETSGLGRAIVYASEDLKNWEYRGEMARAKDEKSEGFMWECPDFFTLPDCSQQKDVLLLSPQGIQQQGEKYLNLFQTGYFVGNYNYDDNSFPHGGFKELDFGHDFYATQTMLAPDGRRIVFAWMAMWESEFPEKEDGWAGALTLPRELILKNDRLVMKPIQELEELRVKRIGRCDKKLSGPTLLCEDKQQAEINVALSEQTSFDLVFKDEQDETFMSMSYDKNTTKLRLERSDKDTTRHARLQDVEQLKIFVDTSSIEIFINDGEAVFTERYYVEAAPKVWLDLKEKVRCQSETYRLDAHAISYTE